MRPPQKPQRTFASAIATPTAWAAARAFATAGAAATDAQAVTLGAATATADRALVRVKMGSFRDKGSL